MNKNTNSTIKLALIGLDTSHVEAFAKLLHDPTNEWHVPGAQITAAFPGGSPDFELSADRVEGFTAKLRDEFDVAICDSIEEACQNADAILIESVDGRVHLEQFRKVVPFGKPVFVDKPFALTGAEAREMASLAEEKGVPLMSCSSLRFSEGLQTALKDESLGAIYGADFWGPMAIQPTQPGFFWYGIHTAEMLFHVLGPNIERMHCLSNEDHDFLSAEWKNGRIGTLRGNRVDGLKFGGILHREKGTQVIDVYAHEKPYYASLLEVLVEFFRTGVSPVDIKETIAVIEFLEQGNRLREDQPSFS